jgi:hypothetical protein
MTHPKAQLFKKWGIPLEKGGDRTIEWIKDRDN